MFGQSDCIWIPRFCQMNEDVILLCKILEHMSFIEETKVPFFSILNSQMTGSSDAPGIPEKLATG